MASTETTIFTTFIILGLFITVIVGYFLYRVYIHNKEYKILQFEKLNAEINAAKTERSFIATELHNDIVPLLASIRFRLGSIVSENKEDIVKCDEALSLCIEDIRSMVRNLAPIEFYDKTFQQAIKEFIENRFKNSTVKIEFRENEYIELKGDKNEYAYRILQEIIENAFKHSKAKKLIIEISKEEGNLLIRTSDDGVGFDLNEIAKSGKRGYGMVGIQNKIEYLKGTIHLNSRINKGTKYNIRIPV